MASSRSQYVLDHHYYRPNPRRKSEYADGQAIIDQLANTIYDQDSYLNMGFARWELAGDEMDDLYYEFEGRASRLLGDIRLTPTGRVAKRSQPIVDQIRSVIGNVEGQLDSMGMREIIEEEIPGWEPNPPYSGWREGWWDRALPKEDKIAYQTKTDALNVFLDWNRQVVDDYGGESMVHSPESFEAINHRFGIKGDRRVDTIAKAVWWAMPPGGPPWHLEDIDVELLNETAPVTYSPRGLAFAIPDFAEQERLLREEEAHYMERWGEREPAWREAGDVIPYEWDEEDDPFG